jgi:hypothetical protein
VIINSHEDVDPTDVSGALRAVAGDAVFLQARIASYMGVSKATVSRVLRRAGLSRLSELRSDEPVQRYERENPGELLPKRRIARCRSRPVNSLSRA